MDWIYFKDERPESSGVYHVSIKRPLNYGGDLTFHYVAYYNAETNEWHKNDGFVDVDDIGERITYQVVGWVKSLGILID